LFAPVVGEKSAKNVLPLFERFTKKWEKTNNFLLKALNVPNKPLKIFSDNILRDLSIN
jgi:hypothetical protein